MGRMGRLVEINDPMVDAFESVLIKVHLLVIDRTDDHQIP